MAFKKNRRLSSENRFRCLCLASQSFQKVTFVDSTTEIEPHEMLTSLNVIQSYIDSELDSSDEATSFRSNRKMTNGIENKTSLQNAPKISQNARKCSKMSRSEADNDIRIHAASLSSPTDDLNTVHDAIVTLNVAGLRYQTYADTLSTFPDTLLGDPAKRSVYWNAEINEFFFDRHRGSFESILYYYQSGGRLKRPVGVATEIFLEEIMFYKLGREAIEQFWANEGYVKPKPVILPENPYLCKLWQLIEHPDSSRAARAVAFFSVFIIVVSTLNFCLETVKPVVEYFQKPVDSNDTSRERYDDWNNPFSIIETVCIVWFTLEFIIRLWSCPSKLAFCKSFLNWVDFLAILPFYIKFALSHGESGSSFAVIRVIRLVRVFRIFKLSRHSRGLQILGLTFEASVRELCLLVFFLCIGLVLFSSAMYFAESSEPGTKFVSIPESFWYSIVTMTTVGYGDMAPTGGVGKLVGAVCAVVGVLVIALPVPVVVENFKHFYRQENKLAKMDINRSLKDVEY